MILWKYLPGEMLTDIRALVDPFLCALTNINNRHRPRGGSATEQGGGALIETPPSRPPQSVTATGVAVPPWQHTELNNPSFSSSSSPPLQMC
jgi:hypothetical protein